MRGRKPTPVEQKIREGNPGHRPLPATILQGGRPLPAEVAEPPDVLGADGRSWWAENVPMMADSGLLDRIDRTNLIMAATAWDDWAKARRVLAQDGMFAMGSVGQIRAHPAIKIAQDAEARFIRHSESFGWNPMSRSRLGLAKLEGASMAAELERILNGDAGSAGGAIEGHESAGQSVGLPGA